MNRDEYVPIPEEELEGKRRTVQKGQAHRWQQPDPADATRGSTTQGKRRKRPISGNHVPQPRKSGEFVIPKLTPSCQDAPGTSSGREMRRPVTYSGSRPLFKRHEDRHDWLSQSSSSGEYWKPPPLKTRRPEGFPEASAGLSDSQPPPVSEDTQGVGWDESGMDPEIEVDITEECEDLNVQLVTMDRSSDSPHPPSPHQAAALDEALAHTDANNNERDFHPVVSVLTEVPSTQPETPPTRRPRESRSRRRSSRPLDGFY